MKVIDLLNKIANKEEVPKKIKVLFNWFEYDEDNYCYKNVDETLDSLLKHLAFYKGIVLNEEVEIIEDTPTGDKKIEKIEERIDTGLVGTEILDEFKVAGAINKQASYIFDIARKINEIIDRLNGVDNE